MHSAKIMLPTGFPRTGRTRVPAVRGLEPIASRGEHPAWTRFVVLMRRGRGTSAPGGSSDDLRTPPRRVLPMTFC